MLDETGSRRVVSLNLRFAVELGEDGLGEDFTELETEKEKVVS